jgi:hypothetical protein
VFLKTFRYSAVRTAHAMAMTADLSNHSRPRDMPLADAAKLLGTAVYTPVAESEKACTDDEQHDCGN